MDALGAQAEPDEQAVVAYLNIVLKAEMQGAKIAGLIVSQPDQAVQRHVVNRDLETWIEERDPTAAARNAYDRHVDEMIYGLISPPAVVAARPARRKRAAKHATGGLHEHPEAEPGG